MLEKALVGSRKYWILVFTLLAIIGMGFGAYLYQFNMGLGVTGLSRDISWGFYIAQFTFLVGVAASAVMLVLPYYLHDYKAFGKITVLGEFLAVASVLMCMLFIFVDMGQPTRVANMFLHPTPGSVMFWDATVLTGYLVLNIVIGWTVLTAERKSMHAPKWVKPLIYLSIPWAVSIHTVTAFLYCGLPGRHFWLTAILAPRFLASAFAGGPALLIILCMIVRKFTRFDPGSDAIQKLAHIITYAMIINAFFIILEIFTAFYSHIPGHMHGLEYLYAGITYEGHYYGPLVPWMWTSTALGVIAIAMLINPSSRRNEKVLTFACVLVFISLWIDKGLGMVIAGFIPTPMDTMASYSPTAPELMITLGVYGVGFLVLTILYKIAIAVKEKDLPS